MKLSSKTLNKNVTHYAIYLLLSLVISVVLYFSFVTLKYNHLHGNQSFPAIKEGSQVGSYFYLSLLWSFALC